MKKSVLLMIDVQNDFVHHDGALYVSKGELVVDNLVAWLKKNKGEVDVIATQDTHPRFHISFPNYWDGDLLPFTTIEPEEIGVTRFPRDLDSLGFLKETITTKHTIWPIHCVKDTWGYFIPERLLKECPINTKFHHKGMNPHLEMYSAISYQTGDIPEEGEKLVETLREYDKIYIAGVATDYCVAETVRDLVKKGLSGKLVFLDQCMAEIDSKNPSLEIYDEAVKGGAKHE